MNRLDYIEENSNRAMNSTHVVIALHGLGADSHDLFYLANHFKFSDDISVKFIFPNAPIRNVTLNNGFPMRGWYDIYALDENVKEDEIGLRESRESIIDLIEEQEKLGIPSNNIVLAGFSQGGALSLYTGLTYDKPLAGIIGFSCYLPLANRIFTEAQKANQKTKIVLYHGENDTIIPVKWAYKTEVLLRKKRYLVNLHITDIEHILSDEELKDANEWLNRIFIT